MPKTDRPRLLSLTEVAERLHLSERTVKRRISEGDLAAHKLGHQWRVAISDIETYLSKHRQGGGRGVL